MTDKATRNKFIHSMGFKILSAYVLLSLINLSFIISIIFENQADLISRSTKLESEIQLTELINSIKKFAIETKKGSLFTVNKSGNDLKEILNLFSMHSRNYFVFSEKGDILVKSADGIEPPQTYLNDGLRSLTVMTFSGKEYYLRIDQQKQVMYCYIPLSGFQLGNSILLLEKEINGMNESLEHLYSQALYVIFIVLFFHTVFALILFRYIIKPVNLLIDGARDLTEGKLNTRIHLPDRNDEFASLAHTFNRMAESMHDNVETLSGEITNARETIEKSGKMTTRDELTGLYSRQYLNERIDEEIKRTAENKSVTGLMLIELDNFKEITSIYGHQTENIIIAETAKKIARTLTGFEITAYYADDMFAVLAPGTSVQVMLDTAEKIRQNICGSSIITADGEFNVTVSIGISCPGEGNNPDILRRADEAMQKARDGGKNRVEIIS